MADKTELKARLAFWQDALVQLRKAYLALLDGGIKSYRIDKLELTRLDLPSLQKRIEEAESKVDELSALVKGGASRRAFVIVPRY